MTSKIIKALIVSSIIVLSGSINAKKYDIINHTEKPLDFTVQFGPSNSNNAKPNEQFKLGFGGSYTMIIPDGEECYFVIYYGNNPRNRVFAKEKCDNKTGVITIIDVQGAPQGFEV
jgi:hypothetical protein